MTRNGVYAAVLDDFENQRSSTVRWLSGHPMDALLFLFASGKTVLVPWDVNIASERSVVDRIIPYTEFKRSFKEAVTTVLRENGVEAAVGGPRARRKVEFPSRTSHLRFLELTEDLPGAEILLRAEGFESFVARSRAVKDERGDRGHRESRRDHQHPDRARQRPRDRHQPGERTCARSTSRSSSRGRRSHSAPKGSASSPSPPGPARSWAIHPFPSCSAGPFGGDGLSILDFGVKVDGYTSDVTLSFAVGKLSPEQERMIGLVEDAYHASMEAARAGLSPQEPARRAERIFSAAGWTMPHALGHGIGLDTHEAPLLRSQGENPDPALLPGMVVTIEPGLYDPRHGGVRWENDVLISEGSSRILTKSRIVRIP